jgi:hypothetical protein
MRTQAKLIVSLIAGVVCATSCGSDRTSRATDADPRQSVTTERTGDWFAERAAESGLDFVHVNGMSGHLYIAEIMAPGVALLDYDNDGDLDVYLVQGQPLDQPDSRSSVTPPRPASLTDRLFRNDLRVAADGSRTLHFTDVTSASGIDARGYGMGVAVGDFDNDGWVDVYLTKFDAPNQLFRNKGDGTFTDVSRRSGTDERGWSVSASFVDVDRDGWLDLFVGNYLGYRVQSNTRCFGASGAANYCTPGSYTALPDRLYRNRGDGTFADVTASAQLARTFGPALGVSTADFNGDGWIDIYVANDGQENQLWLNQRNGTFVDGALLAGVALPADGKREASMGVDAGDFDDDGDEDLIVTELNGEGTNLFVNDGTGLFEDRSAASGMGPATLPFTGFGTAWFDFDNDSRLDLLAVNGTVQIVESLRQSGDPFPLRQRRLLFRNVGGGRFEDVSARGGVAFSQPEVGRGAAFGDIDNDGDVDVVVGNNNGPVRLLINEAPPRRWIGLRLTGERGGRDMVGARVQIVRANGSPLWRRARADGSYASANDPRVLVGLGDSAASPSVTVTWPDGHVEKWAALRPGTYNTLVQGHPK